MYSIVFLYGLMQVTGCEIKPIVSAYARRMIFPKRELPLLQYNEPIEIKMRTDVRNQDLLA